MDYDSVQLLDENLAAVSPAEVDHLEAQLGTTLPKGYRSYITTLGAGVLNDTIRVYRPTFIGQQYRDFQARWAEYWLWDESESVLPKARALECIIVADTLNGDEFILHPTQPDTVYLLPANQSTIYRFIEGLDEALTWALNWDELFGAEDDDEAERPEGLYFEPYPPDA